MIGLTTTATIASLLALTHSTNGFLVSRARPCHIYNNKQVNIASSILQRNVVTRAQKDNKNEDNEYLASFFTGGIFDSKESEEEAIKIASKIKSVSTLGWKQQSKNNDNKKRGNTRPRHRAFGGQDEKPVQLKPNYDESSAFCAEKWLTQEDMNAYLKCTDGPASDTVFVALARGGKYAERDDCEARINEWNSSSSSGPSSGSSGIMRNNRRTNKFDKDAFVKSVKQGRQELIIGWALYLFISGSAAAGIIFPNNPLNKQLETFIDFVRGASGTDYMP